MPLSLGRERKGEIRVENGGEKRGEIRGSNIAISKERMEERRGERLRGPTLPFLGREWRREEGTD